MTDNEIIKALECCSTYKGKCTDCPAFVKVDRSNCKQVLLGAIEIINRQKAEIDRFIVDATTYKLRWAKAAAKLDTAKAEVIKEFAERLKEKTKYMYSAFGIRHEVDNIVKEMVGADNAE